MMQQHQAQVEAQIKAQQAAQLLKRGSDRVSPASVVKNYVRDFMKPSLAPLQIEDRGLNRNPSPQTPPGHSTAGGGGGRRGARRNLSRRQPKADISPSKQQQQQQQQKKRSPRLPRGSSPEEGKPSFFPQQRQQQQQQQRSKNKGRGQQFIVTKPVVVEEESSEDCSSSDTPQLQRAKSHEPLRPGRRGSGARRPHTFEAKRSASQSAVSVQQEEEEEEEDCNRTIRRKKPKTPSKKQQNGEELLSASAPGPSWGPGVERHECRLGPRGRAESSAALERPQARHSRTREVEAAPVSPPAPSDDAPSAAFPTFVVVDEDRARTNDAVLAERLAEARLRRQSEARRALIQQKRRTPEKKKKPVYQFALWSNIGAKKVESPQVIRGAVDESADWTPGRQKLDTVVYPDKPLGGVGLVTSPGISRDDDDEEESVDDEIGQVVKQKHSESEEDFDDALSQADSVDTVVTTNEQPTPLRRARRSVSSSPGYDDDDDDDDDDEGFYSSDDEEQEPAKKERPAAIKTQKPAPGKMMMMMMGSPVVVVHPSIAIIAAKRKKRENRKAAKQSVLPDDDEDSRVSKLEQEKQQRLAETTSPRLPPAGTPQPTQWKCGEQLGEGTFGIVYLALNTRTGELFACKQLSIPLDAPQSEIADLEREIRLLKTIDHAHVVRYLGTEMRRSEGIMYLFMEYVPGGSIAKMLAQFGVFTEELIRIYVGQILKGVEYLHEKKIIHRDIKGANVLVTDSGVAKLADFGCSKQLQGMRTGTLEQSLEAIHGSVPWMAPEVIKQSGHGRSADVWSVGATVIEMATARHPWPKFSNNLTALFQIATATEPPPAPDNLTPRCLAFLSRCLVIDPKRRASATDLLSDEFILTEHFDPDTESDLEPWSA